MKKSDAWFKLDTAGNLYPAIESLHYPAIFRLSATLKETVDVPRLEKAAAVTVERFPSLKVRIRRGLFWFYLEPNPLYPEIWPDNPYPCRRISRKQNNDYLFQIFYKNTTISIDFFHALADGYGGIVFLKTLLAEYFKLAGIPIPNENGILDTEADPDPEELENAFIRYYKGKRKRPVKEPKVYHIAGSKLPQGVLMAVTGEIPLPELLEKTRSYGVSITEYISAVLTHSLYLLQEQEPHLFRKKAIRLSVPVNLRNMFPSKTLRNFSQFIKPGINPDLGDYSFKEILHQVHHAIRYEKSTKYLSAVWSSHVSMELNPVIRVVPLFMKNLVMNIIFNYFGENRFSGTFSNLGPIDIPEAMQKHVDHFDLVLGANPINPVNCSGISYDNKLRITFGRTIKETELEHLFFTHFIKEGIPVTIESDTAPGV